MKGKLRSSSKIVDLPDNEQPQINNNNTPQTVIEYESLSWNTILLGWGKTVILFLLLGSVLVLGIYAGLSSTILYLTSTKDASFIVARGTYVGGIIPEGSYVYVNTDGKIENNFLSNLNEGFSGIKNGAVVKTLAGPVQEIKVDNDKQTISIIENGKVVNEIDGALPEEYNNINYLKNQYLTECLSGACEKGELLIVNQNQVSGEVIKIGK